MAKPNTAKINAIPANYLEGQYRLLPRSTPDGIGFDQNIEKIRSVITERLKVETKLFQNLAMCEAQLKSFTDEFANNVLTGHTMMEWSDRVEKLNRARDMILRLIQIKTNELISEKKT